MLRSVSIALLRSTSKGSISVWIFASGVNYVTLMHLLNLRIAQLGWDVNIENLKLIVIAPDTAFKNTSLDVHIMKQSKRLNCEVIAAYLNPDYDKN